MPIIHGMPMAEYLAHPGINSSKIKIAHTKTMADFHESLKGASNETKSTLLGSAIHDLFDESQEFDHSYAVQAEDWGDKRSGDAKKKWAAFKKESAGKRILDFKTSQIVSRVRATTQSNLYFRFLLASGKTEVTAIHQESESITWKARADLLTKDTIVDWKTTTKDMDDDSLYREIKKYNMAMQAAQLFTVFNAELPDKPIKNFVWAFIDLASPICHIRFLKCPERLLISGIHDLESAKDKIRECIASGIYPGYPQSVQELQLPSWAKENYE